MSARTQVYLWAAQRISAMVLAFCVLVHLLTMIYAVRGGLTAAEILGRTHGNVVWAGFYALFVMAVSVHASIGLRSILAEWLGMRARALAVTVSSVALGLAGFGLRAVWAVIG